MLCCHFVADFLLQSREMGKNKSSNFSVLLDHLLIQFFVLFIGLLFCVNFQDAYPIALLNMVIHGLIDWHIWRGYKVGAHYRMKRGIDKHLYETIEMKEGPEVVWKYYDDHWFYTTIGFDQLLHSLTLVMLWGLYL